MLITVNPKLVRPPKQDIYTPSFQLIPNTIVKCTVVKITSERDVITELRVKANKILSVAFTGK